MNIVSLVVKRINIPFKVSFKHSSAARSLTQSIWVEATSDKGLTGYGEGCPREYVTNESIDSALDFFSQTRADIIAHISGLESLRSWSLANKEKIDENPAAWCAIELALLDLIGKQYHCSIEKILGLPEINSPFQYSAVLGDSSLEVFEEQLTQYLTMGFTDLKIKISGDLEKDLPKFELLTKSKSKKLSIRLDANNLWRNSNDAIDYLTFIPYPLFAIEEPIKSGQYPELKKISQRLDVRIILDESFIRIEDFQNIENHASHWIINLRVSKMGGLLRSLQIAEKARQSGVNIIIGAQVGETSLLTRSALTIANAYRDILIAQEGAFGTFLLQSDICEPPLMFGEKGLLKFQAKQTHGFQLEIKPPT